MPKFLKEMRYLIFWTLVLLSTCGQREKKNENKARAEEAKSSDNSTEFLGLFKEFEPSGLHIYPPSTEGGKLIDSPFNGLEIDVHKYSYLDNDKIVRNIESCKRGQSHIYAVGKFEIDENTLALLFRQHSQYWESAIEFAFWDKNRKVVIKGVDLADSFGDEGWYFEMESWILKRGSSLEIVTRRKDSNYNDETQVRTQTDSISRRLLLNRTFTQGLISKSDTTRYPLKNWP